MKTLFSFAYILALGFGITLASPKPSQAEFITGNTLYEFCTEPASSETYYMQNTACQLYILGTFDSIQFSTALQKAMGQESTTLFCVSNTVKSGQLMEIIVRYLHENPQDRHESAAGLTALALIEAFPCPSVSES